MSVADAERVAECVGLNMTGGSVIGTNRAMGLPRSRDIATRDVEMEEPVGPERSGEMLETVVEEGLSEVLDSISGIPIPRPVKRNLFKALGRLIGAAVDVPVAWLEGIASERRAETAARVKIIGESGEQIAEGMEVDRAYVDRAARKFAERVVREQQNLDDIAERAVKQLGEEAPDLESAEAPTAASAEEISDDWLHRFEKEASQKSSDEMRTAFSRILAGEIVRPGSFSIKAIKAMGELDTATATLFQRLCSCATSLQVGAVAIIDARVVSVEGSAGSNGLAPFDLGFDQLTQLEEYGLIISDFNSWRDYAPAIVHNQKVPLPFCYGGRAHGLLPRENAKASQLRVNGVALSKVGRELLQIVDINPVPAYTAALSNFFEKRGFEMVRIGTAEREQ